METVAASKGDRHENLNLFKFRRNSQRAKNLIEPLFLGLKKMK
jgi:hypothetical protein